MTTHLTDDELVLHYYGEMTDGDERRAVAHLAACSGCHADYRRLQRVLAAVDEVALAGPELPASFERAVWARLEPTLGRRRGPLAWLAGSPSRLAWAAAVLVLVAAAYMVGRLSPAREAPSSPTAPASAGQVRERILLIDLGDHLERSQMVLVEIVTADAEQGLDLSTERARAEQLVAANRLYRQTAAATGDRAIAAFLDELERVLVDVAASPEQLSAAELGEVRRRIDAQALLFKVQVLSAEVRERQKNAFQRQAAARSSSL